MCTTFVLIFVEYIGVLVGYLCPYCEYLTMNGGLGLCLMFVLAAAQVGESSSGKVVGHNDDDDA